MLPVESASVQEYLDQLHDMTTLAAIQVPFQHALAALPASIGRRLGIPHVLAFMAYLAVLPCSAAQPPIGE